MAIVFKSNNVASKNIGNSFGAKSTNDYSMMLDFERGFYGLRQGSALVEHSIESVLSCSRASQAWGEDVSGSLIPFPENTLRIARNNGHKGLIVEGNRINYFKDSNNPKSQTVAFSPTTNRMILWCKGSGSISVSGTNLTILSANSVATEGQPVVFCPTNTSAVGSVNYTVSGELVHAQHEVLAANYFYQSSRIVTNASANTDRKGETIQLKSEHFNTVFPNKRNYTVVVHAYMHDILALVGTTPISTPASIFRVNHGSNDVEPLFYATSESSVLSINGTGILTNAIPEIYDNTKGLLTTAVAIGPTISSIGANGVSKYTAVTHAAQGADALSFVLGTGSRQFFGVIKKIVVYPRTLTAEELAVLSSSWV